MSDDLTLDARERLLLGTEQDYDRHDWAEALDVREARLRQAVRTVSAARDEPATARQRF